MTDQPEQPAPLHVFLSDTAEAALAQLRPGRPWTLAIFP